MVVKKPHLWTVRLSAIFAVAMPLKIKVGQAADVTHTFYEDSVIPHKLQDGVCAVGQGEVQHKRRQQNASHLLHKQAGLQQTQPCSRI